MSIPTHVYAIENQGFVTRYKPAGKHTRYKLVPDPEPPPPQKPELVWFDFEGEITIGAKSLLPDGGYYVIATNRDLKYVNRFTQKFIEERGITLRTDFAEGEA